MSARKRNACLATIERMRKACGDIRLNDAVAFLYICENEGINVRELAQLAGLTASSASRTARRLTGRDTAHALAPALDLIDMRQQPTDRRGRVLTLTAKGRRLQHDMNQVILAATPILLDGA